MKILAYDLPLSYWERVAQQNGISLRSFHHRLNRYAPNIAATMPLKNTGKPVNPKSARQQSLAAGLPFWAITQYRRQNPNTTLTNAQIASELTRQRASYKTTLSKKAKAAGIAPGTVYRRIFTLGWSQERALNTPPMSNAQSARLAAKASAESKRLKRAQQASVK